MAQRENETLKPTIKLAESGSSSDYILRNDILYKNCDGNMLFVVPKVMQEKRFAREQAKDAIEKVQKEKSARLLA